MVSQEENVLLSVGQEVDGSTLRHNIESNIQSNSILCCKTFHLRDSLLTW